MPDPMQTPEGQTLDLIRRSLKACSDPTKTELPPRPTIVDHVMGRAVEIEKKHQQAVTACENKVLEPAASYFSRMMQLKEQHITELEIQRRLERERASIEENRADIHSKNAETAMEVAKDYKCMALVLSLEVAELRGEPVVRTAELEQDLKKCQPRLERMELQKTPIQPRRSPEQKAPQLDANPRAMMLAKK